MYILTGTVKDFLKTRIIKITLTVNNKQILVFKNLGSTKKSKLIFIEDLNHLPIKHAGKNKIIMEINDSLSISRKDLLQ